MIFEETALDGVVIVRPEPIEDERGFFARTWCAREFQERGLTARLAQCSISYSRRRGTLRGMHFQRTPHAEAKLVRCTSGAVYDVVVDIRPESTTFGRWLAVELTARDRRALYIPDGFAHGFEVLTEDTELLYQMDVPYVPGASAGFRWNDPAVGIVWPMEPEVISQRDRALPPLAAVVRSAREPVA